MEFYYHEIRFRSGYEAGNYIAYACRKETLNNVMICEDHEVRKMHI